MTKKRIPEWKKPDDPDSNPDPNPDVRWLIFIAIILLIILAIGLLKTRQAPSPKIPTSQSSILPLDF
jgi:hypothetical protein